MSLTPPPTRHRSRRITSRSGHRLEPSSAGAARVRVAEPAERTSSPVAPAPVRPWWRWNVALGLAAAVGVAVVAVADPGQLLAPGSVGWWAAVTATHMPWLLLLAFLVGGVIERIGYFARGRKPAAPGRLPDVVPRVCVQLPMFNEAAVARRCIAAACALEWPADRLEIQVLDDSTEPDTRRLVEAMCADMRRRGVDCRLLRREQRDGYKAGALEAGRRVTDADLIVIFDADFVAPTNYLEQAVPHFFDADGRWIDDLALVQAQWGHLNHDESPLTRAQSLWVDDHHTIQMSWRAAKWDFVNFTGTAGIWRASAIERAGGWRAASLVEDCELSFRHLFAGYRTTFVKEIVAPAELPATVTAYKAQQRRWTQGWVQLQRLHLHTLLFDYDTRPTRRLHLLYHMCISVQWALWAVWLLLLPFLIATGMWVGALGLAAGAVAYLVPTSIWLTLATVIASIEAKHTYRDPLTVRVLLRRLGRVVPYVVINTGMLPHQFSAFTEGLFGPMHAEFERTPKAATVTHTSASSPAAAHPPRRQAVKVHRPYIVAEFFFIGFQAAWTILFIRDGLWLSAAGSAALAVCVITLMYFYGDHLGRRLFVLHARTRT